MAEAPAVKPGYRTTEFWASVIGSLLPMVSGTFPPWISAVLIGVYTLSRAMVKGLPASRQPPDAP